MLVKITDVAKKHFRALLEKEDESNLKNGGTLSVGLRLFLDHPGSATAEVGIAFCPKAEEKASDMLIEYPEFKLFIDKQSAPFLEEADINYKEDEFGGQLAITAPHLRGKKPTTEAPLEEQIAYVLTTEINPNLASHGGMVSLIGIKDNIVELKFGGGCHGCGMVDLTLKEGIEKTLKEKFPNISGVVDVTNHETGTNPYFS